MDLASLLGTGRVNEVRESLNENEAESKGEGF